MALMCLLVKMDCQGEMNAGCWPFVYRWLADKSEGDTPSAMLNSGDYLPMAKVVHLIIWRNAWVWAGLTACVPLSVVFILNIHLCLWTGGRWSKFLWESDTRLVCRLMSAHSTAHVTVQRNRATLGFGWINNHGNYSNHERHFCVD
jgi:hypothetical protein